MITRDRLRHRLARRACSRRSRTSEAAPPSARRCASASAYLDTSPFYGYGRSEHILGDVLRETKADVVLSTKVGRLLEPYWGDERRAGRVDRSAALLAALRLFL